MSGMVRMRTRPAIHRPAQPQNRSVRGPQRERHEPDYLLMLSIIALSALGLLMVYSSSGVDSLIHNGDPFALVGSQAIYGVLGVVTMVLVMRMDYRYLRLISVIGFAVALVLLVVVMLPPIGPMRPVEVGGSTRWLKIGPLPQFQPAELAKLALVVYLAHWLTRKGTQIKSFRRGLVAFMLIVGPPAGCCHGRARPRHHGRPRDGCGHDVLRRRRFAVQLGGNDPLGVGALAVVRHEQPIPAGTRESLHRPLRRPAGDRLPHRSGTARDGHGRALGIGLGGRQPGALHVPVAQSDFVFALVAQELGLVGGIVVIACYLLLAYRGIRIALSAPGHFRGAAGGGHHELADAPGVHQHRRSGRPVARHRHHVAVRLVRRRVASRELRRGGYSPVDLARDPAPRKLHQCGF